MERFATAAGHEGRYMLPSVPRPGDPAPLAMPLAKAVDAGARGPPATAVDAPFTADEVRAVLATVVDRINARTPGLALALVSFDNVRKSVDAYKTVAYSADAMLHSPSQGARGVTSKVTVAVDVDSRGTHVVRGLSVHNAGAVDPASPAPAGPLAALETHARFEPAVRY